mmetsp:Transcript_13915/g.30053  ORF Transcript_13915/g.30053 Transcript_13915/m.30053 type:complete len:98 (-) Transcript_13915:352-645(-)
MVGPDTLNNFSCFQQTISIAVRDQAGTEVFFKVKPQTKFQKVFEAYCQKKAVDINSIRFVYDGVRISKDSSPVELGMEDGDVVDAVVEQVGGRQWQN